MNERTRSRLADGRKHAADDWRSCNRVAKPPDAVDAEPVLFLSELQFADQPLGFAVRGVEARLILLPKLLARSVLDRDVTPVCDRRLVG